MNIKASQKFDKALNDFAKGKITSTELEAKREILYKNIDKPNPKGSV